MKHTSGKPLKLNGLIASNEIAHWHTPGPTVLLHEPFQYVLANSRLAARCRMASLRRGQIHLTAVVCLQRKACIPLVLKDSSSGRR